MKILGKISALMLIFMVFAMPAAYSMNTVSEFSRHSLYQDSNNDFMTIDVVRINGDRAEDGDILYVERGDDLRVRVSVEAGNNDVSGAQILGVIAGYRYSHYERNMVTDWSNTFNLPAQHRRSFDLNLKVPMDIEQKDAKLRILVLDSNSDSVITYNYQLAIHGADRRDAVQIRNFFISPSTVVEPGRPLSFRLQVKNMGNRDLDDVTARVSIPELNLATYETIDSLRMDQTLSFEALFLSVPRNVEPGIYTVEAVVEFDRFESVKRTAQIEITGETTGVPAEDASIADSTQVTMPQTVSLEIGGGEVVFPILIENKQGTAKTYVLSAHNTDFARTSFEPSSLVVVQAGQSQTVYLRMSARDTAEPGDKVFNVRIESGDDSKTVNAVATLTGVETSTTDLRTILEWGLVILVILLVLLGLILVFTRMRNQGKEDVDEETQTYY